MLEKIFSTVRSVFAGRKTHILVLLAIIGTTFQNVVEGGRDLGDVSMWVDNAKLAMISTFKMMFDRG